MFELMPYSGFGSLGRLRRDMDDVWKRFFDAEPGPPAPRGEGFSFVPVVNVKETDEALEITAEVPGLKPEEIEVSLTGDILTLKGEKKEEREEDKGDYHLVERRFGSFQRGFRLPMEVERQKLSARHKDGVLCITLPKAKRQAATTIKVEAE
ncbi:MAG: Hsp20/alpha crystallin family protein [Desulfarculus sp.]|nr:Hsp20/alpha crystallin family protein [Desulfarculus sp.]